MFDDAAADGRSQTNPRKTEPCPKKHSTEERRLRAGQNSPVKTPAAALIKALAMVYTQVASRTCSIMLKRHQDIPVFEEAALVRNCLHFKDSLDIHGNHALACRQGLSVIIWLSEPRNSIARCIIKEAGLQYSIELRALIRDRDFHTANIVVRPPTSEPGIVPARPSQAVAAYDGTVSHNLATASVLSAAARIAGAADQDALRRWNRVRTHLSEADSNK